MWFCIGPTVIGACSLCCLHRVAFPFQYGPWKTCRGNGPTALAECLCRPTVGIRRAIGAKPRDIIVQVLSEGAALTVISGLAGLCMAAAVLGIMHKINNPPDAVSVAHFQMSFSQALMILATFIALGTLAGLIPSIKAMKIKPIEAINSK